MKRAGDLLLTLNSIVAQEGPNKPVVHMSWSSASEEIATAVKSGLASLALPTLIATEQKERKSQFEHLKELSKRFTASSAARPSWVFFSDDDDIWSENRYHTFLNACQNANEETQALVCTRKARPSHVDVHEDDLHGWMRGGASTVREMVHAGEIRHTDLLSYSDPRESSFSMDEYFDYAVRLDVLLNFFKAAPNVLIKHKLCDLAFTATLRSKEMGRVTFTPESDDDFVYFYTRAENAPYADSFTAGASTGVEIGAEDEALAKEGHSSVEAALAGVPKENRFLDDPHMLGFFLSCLRQAVEQELVQLRVISPTPKLRVTDEICERHVDLLLESHPLTGTKEIEPFRQWCIATARGAILRVLLKKLGFELPRGRDRR